MIKHKQTNLIKTANHPKHHQPNTLFYKLVEHTEDEHQAGHYKNYMANVVYQHHTKRNQHKKS